MRDKVPMEQPILKRMLMSVLDYFLNQHGFIVVTYVRCWLEEKGIHTED